MRCPPESMFEKVGRAEQNENQDWSVSVVLEDHFPRKKKERRDRPGGWWSEGKEWRLAVERERERMKHREWDSISSFSHISCNSFRIPKSGLEHDKIFIFCAKGQSYLKKKPEAFRKTDCCYNVLLSSLFLKNPSRFRSRTKQKCRTRLKRAPRISLYGRYSNGSKVSGNPGIWGHFGAPNSAVRKSDRGSRRRLSSNKGFLVWTRDNLQKFRVFRCALPRSVFVLISDFESIMAAAGHFLL